MLKRNEIEIIIVNIFFMCRKKETQTEGRELGFKVNYSPSIN